MEFTPLTIIAGTNASGKSNLFDALKLLSTLAETDNLKKAFKEQRGEFIELFTQFDEGQYADEMSFAIEMLVNKKVKDAWGNSASLKYTRMRYELTIRRYSNLAGMADIEVTHESLINLKHQEDKWINLIPKKFKDWWRPKVALGRRGIPYINTVKENDILTVEVPQDGKAGGNKRRFPLVNASRTVLSSFDTVDFPHVLAAKEEMKSWRFLQLNPEDLRKPTNKSTGDDKISESGENLAAALNRISAYNSFFLTEISRKLHSFIPNFIDVKVIDDKENKQYVIKLLDKDKKEYTSRVLSEGTLRVLALCILEYDDSHTGLLCFEEPENGIHPFRIATMSSLLKDLTTDFSDEVLPLRQAIVNTHSPILVKEIKKWNNDPNVSIWMSQMSNVVVKASFGKIKLSITKILPVEKEHEFQLQIPYSDAERRMTLTKVNEYLETTENLQ